MNIDISKVEFEERVEDSLGNIVAYFIAPKEFLGDKYTEAEHSTISIEWNDCGKDMSAYTAMISPTKDGEDYDWLPLDLDISEVEQLVIKSIRVSYNPVAEAYKLLVNEMYYLNDSPDYIISAAAIEEAIEYLGEALE